MTMPGSEVTMEEIAEQVKAAEADAAKPDLTKIVLDGDGVPEELRGRSVMDVLKDHKVLGQSLQIANAARLAAEAAAKSAPPPATPVVPVTPVATPRMTKEEWNSLYESDPMSAIAYMNQVATEEAELRFERRFGSLTTGAASAAEVTAREKFATEFELFGPEIKQITDGLPDKSMLANPAGWDMIVSAVRGKPGNFEKLIEARTAKAAKAAAEAARANEERNAGASLTTSTVRTAPSAGVSSGEGNFGLSDEEQRVARNMNMSLKEYAYWKKIGG